MDDLVLAGLNVGLFITKERAVVFAVNVAVLIEAESIADAPTEFLDRLLGGQLKVLGEACDLFFADPYIAGATGAAMAALLAGETQALGVPRLGTFILDNTQLHGSVVGAKTFGINRQGRIGVRYSYAPSLVQRTRFFISFWA
jgi:hypothetical protein